MGELIPLFGADDAQQSKSVIDTDEADRFAAACIPAAGCENCELFAFYVDELPNDIMHGLKTTEGATKYLNNLRNNCLARRALGDPAIVICPNSTPMG